MDGQENKQNTFEIHLEEITSSANASAEAESQALATGENLEKEAEKNQHGRRERIRDIISQITCWWVKVAAALLVLATIIWFWHLLLPESLKWLSNDEVIAIKEILSNIIVGAVFGYLAKERFM